MITTINEFKSINENNEENFELGTPAIHHFYNYNNEQQEQSGEIVMNNKIYIDKKTGYTYQPNTVKGILLYPNSNYSGSNRIFIVPNWDNVENFYTANNRLQNNKDFIIK